MSKKNEKTVIKHTFKNVRMDILGAIRLIPEVTLTKAHKGGWCISFDEYNRISDEIHYEIMKTRKK